MRSDTIGSAFDAHCLRLIGCLAALVIASEAGAGALFPGQKFSAGAEPFSVAVADLDGDTVPDLVTANARSDDVTVLINLCDPAAGPEIDIERAKTQCGRKDKDYIRIGGVVDGFSSSQDRMVTIDGDPPIFGPVDVIIFADEFEFEDGEATATVPIPGGEVQVSFPETGSGSFQINVDAVGLNECPENDDPADLILVLNGTEDRITVERATDSKFRSALRCGLGFELALLLPPLMAVYRRRRHTIH